MLKKQKSSFFHKPSKKDDISLKLPKLTISNNVSERPEFIKFLGVLLDENLNWKEHIKCTENKIVKNLGLLSWCYLPLFFDKNTKGLSLLNRVCVLGPPK